jgi:site-specific recombinase XerD
MTSPSARKTFPAEVLTPDEIQALIGAYSPTSRTGIRNRALLTFLYRSGLRISEAIGYPGRPEQAVSLPDGQKIQKARDPIPPLKVSDVNLTAHTIRVLHTKSGKPQTRGLHPSATDALARWFDVRRQLGFNGRQPAFSTLRGEPLSEQYVRACLGRLAKKADITKRVHPHSFRHTFAVELEMAGTPVTVISKLLGHSSVSVTARYLDHLSNGQAVAVLEGVTLPSLED